eukprot:4946337-Pyramimonas_sp.AAC.1
MVSINIGDANKDHIYTPKEMAFPQGWPTFSKNPELRDLLPFDISEMTQTLGKTTLGNGMHLVAEESWFCFVASHTIRRDV